MYNTNEYFPDRRVVRNVRYIPNPTGTIIHDSKAITPSTWVADSRERQSIHSVPLHNSVRNRDMGYARGIDAYEEAPYDEFALRRPSAMHGRMEKISGKLNATLGRLVRNPRRAAQGEEQEGLGDAEVDMAKSYLMHGRQPFTGYDVFHDTKRHPGLSEMGRGYTDNYRAGDQGLNQGYY